MFNSGSFFKKALQKCSNKNFLNGVAKGVLISGMSGIFIPFLKGVSAEKDSRPCTKGAEIKYEEDGTDGTDGTVVEAKAGEFFNCSCQDIFKADNLEFDSYDYIISPIPTENMASFSFDSNKCEFSGIFKNSGNYQVDITGLDNEKDEKNDIGQFAFQITTDQITTDWIFPTLSLLGSCGVGFFLVYAASKNVKKQCVNRTVPSFVALVSIGIAGIILIWKGSCSKTFGVIVGSIGGGLSFVAAGIDIYKNIPEDFLKNGEKKWYFSSKKPLLKGSCITMIGVGGISLSLSPNNTIKCFGNVFVILGGMCYGIIISQIKDKKRQIDQEGQRKVRVILQHYLDQNQAELNIVQLIRGEYDYLKDVLEVHMPKIVGLRVFFERERKNKGSVLKNLLGVITQLITDVQKEQIENLTYANINGVSIQLRRNLEFVRQHFIRFVPPPEGIINGFFEDIENNQITLGQLIIDLENLTLKDFSQEASKIREIKIIQGEQSLLLDDLRENLSPIGVGGGDITDFLDRILNISRIQLHNFFTGASNTFWNTLLKDPIIRRTEGLNSALQIVENVLR